MSGLLPGSRRQRHTTLGGSYKNINVIAKPKSLCQCYDKELGTGCTREVKGSTLFCDKHASCQSSPQSGAEPKYDPELYNSNPDIYKSHNCYSYGMNVIDNKLVTKCRKNTRKNTCRQNFHQPGALNGDRYTLNAEERRTCPVVEKLMKSDVPTIKKTAFYSTCPKDMSKIALVVDPGEDYHFYRQDSNGLWSHKDGSNKVKRVDALKRTIANPKFAARDYRWQGSDLNYEDFCGFYCVPRYDEVHLGQGGALSKLKQEALWNQSLKQLWGQTRKAPRKASRKAPRKASRKASKN